jgi:thiol-disulfide isomerase/thioredoxin
MRMLKKKNFLLAAALLMLTVFAPVYAEDGLSTHDIFGNRISLAKRGQWIVVNYWAAWCSACISEIPDLNRFAQLAKNANVVFVAVNYDQLPNDMQQLFAKHYGVNYTLLHDNPWRNYVPEDTITSLPMTYVISPTGQTRELSGTQTAESILQAIS